MLARGLIARRNLPAAVVVAALTAPRNDTLPGGTGAAAVCDTCCTVYTYAVPLGDGWALNVVGTVGAAVSLAMVVFLLVRMSWYFRDASTRGYGYMSAPVTAIRERRDGAAVPVWILPWYYG